MSQSGTLCPRTVEWWGEKYPSGIEPQTVPWTQRPDSRSTEIAAYAAFFVQKVDVLNLHFPFDSFHHVVYGQASHRDGGEGLHFNTGFRGGFDAYLAAEDSCRVSVLLLLAGKILWLIGPTECYAYCLNGNSVAQWNEQMRVLGGLNCCQAGDTQYIAFLSVPRLDQACCGPRHQELTTGGRFTDGHLFCGNIHHVCFAVSIEMGG